MNSFISAAPTSESLDRSEPVRVMIVEDSLVVRGLLTRWIEAEGGMRVVASVNNGALALERIKECGAEVVILDIDMPVMDGIEALPKLLALCPAVKVIMSSTLTLRNAQISLKALSLGAIDYIAKPDSVRGVTCSQDYRRELIEKVRALASTMRRANLASNSKPVDFALAKAGALDPKIIAIGSSTGGPQALSHMLRAISGELTVPILITQHMPPMFTSILAEHLSRSTGRPAYEVTQDVQPQPGTIYIAPGGRHLSVSRQGGGPVLQLHDGEPENFCKPSVDVMFRSVAKCYGRHSLGIVLTGMGHDGREGARAIVDAGGGVIAQDQSTSIVWGMPGAVADAGLACAVLPLGEIANKIMGLVRGARL